MAFRADATEEPDVDAVMDAAMREFGRNDVLHSNVGRGGAAGLPDQITPELWHREMDQDLTSASLGIRCVVPRMRSSTACTI